MSSKEKNEKLFSNTDDLGDIKENNSFPKKKLFIIIGIILSIAVIVTIVLITSYNKSQYNEICTEEKKEEEKLEQKLEEKKEEEDTAYYIEPSSGKHTNSLIFIHGLGGKPEYYAPLLKLYLKFDKLSTTRIVLPRAKNDASSTPSWFDITMGGYSYGNMNYSDIDISKEIILKYIEKEAKLLDGQYNKIMLAGHSQGAIMTLYIGYSTDFTLGGLVVLSGILLPKTVLKPDKKNLHVFLAHGEKDTTLPIDIHKLTLSLKGFTSTAYPGLEIHYYEELDHLFIAEEWQDLTIFLNKYMK